MHKHLEAIDSESSDWRDFKPGDRWGGYNKYSVFNILFTMPERFSGKTVILRILTGHENGWDAVNPQFTAYVNGCLVQGLNVNHREIMISEAATAGEVYNVILQAFSGMEDKSSKYGIRPVACCYGESLERSVGEGRTGHFAIIQSSVEKVGISENTIYKCAGFYN